MTDFATHMKRCLQLAEKGLGSVAPNPMVGCVIVENNETIGEGFHEEYGKAHAEVNAIAAVQQKERLKNATLFVNLEPCSHHGKTPPCSDLIISSGIKKVIIGNTDTNPLVAGKGIERLKNAGIEVISGILEEECRFFNRRFFTFHEQKRPYIILKWAQTADGFISKFPVPSNRSENIISSAESLKLSHQWRAEEMAIMVGTHTALADNPELTVRHAHGKNPLRVLIDRNLSVPKNFSIFNNSAKTIVFTEQKTSSGYGPIVEIVSEKFDDALPQKILRHLFQKGISSVIIEGGQKTLQHFIDKNYFDEVRVFTSTKKFGSGVKAPAFGKTSSVKTNSGEDTLEFYYNR